MEFCSYFEQIADSPNFLRKLALEFCLRPKSLKLRHSSNWAANLFKIWQNSNASLSVAYLFFIIYLKSKVWIITRLENLSGVYVECYRFLIFVVTDSVYYKYQYRLTYTLCSDLNSVSLLFLTHTCNTINQSLHPVVVSTIFINCSPSRYLCRFPAIISTIRYKVAG